MVNVKFLRLGVDTSKVKTGVQQGRDELGRYTAKAKEASLTTNRLERRFRSLGTEGSRLRGSLVGVFGAVAGGQAFRESVRTIASYETQLTTLRGVAGATSDEFERLSEQSRELGATTAFSASQSAEAQTNLARAGLQVNEILGATPGILDAAIANQLSLAESSEIGAATMNQFGLEAEGVGGALNDFTVIANNSATNVSQLARAMIDAGTISAQYGESTGSTAAALGVLADRMIRGERAGVQVRQILLGLIDPSNEARQAFEELGIQYDEIDPRTKSLADIFERFGQSVGFADQAAKIFGDRQAVGATILSESSDRMRELEELTKQLTGETNTLARAQEDTLAGAFKTLKSSAEELFLSAGERGLSGALRDVVEVGTDVIRFFAGVETRTSRFAQAADVAAGVITGLLVVSVVKATVAVAGLTAALATNPFGLMAIGIGAAAAALISYRRELIKVGPIVVGVGELGQATFEHLTDIATSFGEAWESLYTRLRNSAEFTWLFVSTQAQNAFDRIVIGALEAEKLIPTGFGGRDNAVIDADIAVRTGEIFKRDRRFEDESARLRGEIDAEDRDASEAFSRAGVGISDRARELTQNRLERDRQAIEKVVPVAQRVLSNFFLLGAESADKLSMSTKDARASVEDFNDTTQSLTVEQSDAQSRIEGMFHALEFEKKALSLTNDERLVAIELLELEKLAKEGGIEDTDKLTEAYRKQAEELAKLQRSQDIGREFAESIGTAFRNVVRGTESVGQAFENMAQRIIDAVFEAAAVQPLINALTGNAQNGTGAAGFANFLFGAQGLAFSGGSPVYMANGGVINSPTAIPMANGQLAIAGEAGTEVVMPATRMPSGNVGVEVSGMRGDTFNINISAPDVQTGLQLSERQVMQRTSRAASRRR